MRKGSIQLFLLSAVLLGQISVRAAEIPLPSLPWSHVWRGRYQTTSYSVFNRALFGGPLRIGGTQYASGVCGHTPMSLTYNLEGAAEEFRAEIGVDDQDASGDGQEETSVWFVVLADRREVLKREMKPGEKAQKIRIDLRGVSQLELRGAYGKGFRRQRPAFANPVFVTAEVERLRAVLKRSAQRDREQAAFSPDYPDAPAWKKIRIEKVVREPFRNAYRISNETLEMTVVPEFGGRLMELRFVNGKNLQAKNQKFNPAAMRIHGLSGDFAGGVFMRLLPAENYFFPADTVLKHGCYSVAFPEEGTVVMRSAESSLFRMVYEYCYRLNGKQVEMTFRIYNKAPFSQPLGVWPILRVPWENLMLVEMPQERDAFKSKMGNAVEFRRSAEGYRAVLKTDCRKNDFFLLKYAGKKPEFRAMRNDGTALHWRGSEMEEHQFFFSRRFVELEALSKVREVPPGGVAAFSGVLTVEQTKTENQHKKIEF